MLPGRIGMIILSALVAHTGWHWMTERWDALASARWPVVDLAGITVALLWIGALVIVGGIVQNIAGRLRLEPAAGQTRSSRGEQATAGN